MPRRSLAWVLVVAIACSGGADDPADDAGGDGPVAVDAAPGPTAADLFDESQVGRLALTIAPADWQWLNDNAELEQYVRGDLRWRDVTVGSIGVRYKGSVGSLRLCFDQQGNRTCPKLSMKLDFGEYLADQRFLGLKHLNVHAMMRDPSHMKDRVAYGLFRAAGVPAPRAAHARLSVNGADLGLFVLVEAIDGEFVEDHFAAVDGTGAGNLYKEVWPVSTVDGPYRTALETNEGPTTDVSKMVRFAQALAAATPTTVRATLATWTDLPTLVSYLAVDRLIDHWDGFVGWYCNQAGQCGNHNYFWYEETARDRVWLVPWDLDNTMMVPSPIRTSYGMPDWTGSPTDCALRPIFLGFLGRPPACDRFTALMVQALWTDYQARTAEVLAGIAAPGAIEAQLDAMRAQLAPEVATDPFGPGPAAWDNAVTALRANVPALRARVAP